jgi:hypothetical protein
MDKLYNYLKIGVDTCSKSDTFILLNYLKNLKFMNRFALTCLLAVFMLSGCTSNYYLTVSDVDTPIYSTNNGYDNEATILAGKAFLYSGRTGRATTRYGAFSGYSTRIATWKPLKKLSKKQLKDLAFTTDYGYTLSGVPVSLYQYGKLNKNYPSYTPASTTRATSTKSTKSSGGSVQVKGYTRKDGTYVRPHTRSAPRRH